MVRRFARKIKRKLLQYAYLFGKNSLTKMNESQNSISQSGEILNASIAPIYENKQGILTIISDDGMLSTGKVLDELSREYAVPITIAGTVLNVGWHVKWWRKALKENPYIELVNHSYNHVRMEEGKEISNDKRKLIHELAHSKTYFEKRFGKKQISFVCPENQMCSMGYQILKEQGVLAIRQGTRGLNDVYPANGLEPGEYYNLKCMGIMDDSSEHAEETRQSWIQTAVKDHKWMIEMWHNVREDSLEGYQTILTKDAKIHLAHIRDHKENDGLWVARFNDVIKYFYERDHSKVFASYDERGIYVSLEMEYECHQKAFFDVPLTICMNVPKACLEKIRTNELKSDLSGKLYLELIPGEKKEILFS